MVGRIYFLFIAVPLAELYLLFQLADYTSGAFAFALVIVTGFVGASLARWQGLQTVRRIQSEMAQGQPPADALMHGLCILIAGALLITPGIMTDFVGFSLLIPPVRSWLARRIIRRYASKFMQQGGGAHWTYTSSGFPGGAPTHDEIIETRIIEEGEEDAAFTNNTSADDSRSD